MIFSVIQNTSDQVFKALDKFIEEKFQQLYLKTAH